MTFEIVSLNLKLNFRSRALH